MFCDDKQTRQCTRTIIVLRRKSTHPSPALFSDIIVLNRLHYLSKRYHKITSLQQVVVHTSL